ncbi:hypothetical protein BGX26_010285 [Mortierella sp. AD094]|nr:hypothetical protein BGX26_010285 [Mortierella sp. AD094]
MTVVNQTPSEKKRRSRKNGVRTPSQEPNFVGDTISKHDQGRAEAHNDDHAKESSVTSPNQYITIINKRIRNVKKRIAKIDKNEAILESDPSAKEKMDPAQIESIERKRELTATLKELETIMNLFNEQHSKVSLDSNNLVWSNITLSYLDFLYFSASNGAQDTSDHALENLSSVLESGDLSFTQQYEESLTASSLQLVRFFFAIKELEDVGQSAGKRCSSSLEILAPFRSYLFKVAATADISKSKSDVQAFRSMIKKLADASLDAALEGSSATYKIICDELDHILNPSEDIKPDLFDENSISSESNIGLKLPLPVNEPCDDFENRALVNPRDTPQSLTSNTTLVGTTQPESMLSNPSLLKAQTKAEVKHTMREESLKSSFRQTGIGETALTSKLADLDKPVDRVSANPSCIGTQSNPHQAPMVPSHVATEYNGRLYFVEPFDQEQNQIVPQVVGYVQQSPQTSIFRQCPEERIQGLSNTELQYQGQHGGEDSSHAPSSSHVGVQPEPPNNQGSRRGGGGGGGGGGRGCKQYQHQRAGNNTPLRQQDTHPKHAGPPPPLAACPGLQLQQLTSVHVQPIFHQQYYQYPHYYYPGYPASYTGVMTNEPNPSDVATGESEAPCQPRSLAPIHEHEEYSN